MKKVIFTLVIVAISIFITPFHSTIEKKNDPILQIDSKELQYQDMLVLFLLPEIKNSINNYYSLYLTQDPMVYPYMISIVKSERVEGYRSFHFLITLDVIPVVGAHNSIGKDRLTLEFDPSNEVKVVQYEHVETYEHPEKEKTTKNQ